MRSIAIGYAILTLGALAAAHPSALNAQPSAPASQVQSDSPAARAGMNWLSANKMTDDAAFIATMRDLWPTAPGTPDQWMAARDRFRYLTFNRLGAVSADKAELWLFDPDLDGYVIATVTVRADDPSKVRGIGLRPTPDLPPGMIAPAGLAEPALIAAVRKKAAHDATENRFSGAVLIARRGKTLLAQAYGVADREAGKPNTLDTQFRFGSMGKMFTAVAIMQLIESGKVDASVPIGRYLPGYANQEIANGVTVANLLTHTGGTGDIFGPEFDHYKASLAEPKDYVALYEKRAPLFPAGSRAAYSNFGFMLLGRIVETVSGLRYDDYIARHIFAPAGMRSTGNLPESIMLPRRAQPYMTSGTKLKRANDTLPVRGTPAGGGYSTVGDFGRFTDALTAGRLMKPATLQALIQGGVKLPDGTFTPYDFGGTIPGRGRFIGHGGGAPGMNGALLHFMDSGYTIVALANIMPPESAAGLANFVVHRLPAN
jgi:CubicO group peptidase (beta-lactamase class C family)